MMPGMNPRQMQKMMKQMGIQQEEMDASRVEIFCPDKKIIIEPADVAMVDMMGQLNFQVSGQMREEPYKKAVTISEEDVAMVVERTSVSAESAREALESVDGDLAEAIMKLQE
ncbi:nascent polypeptide-associated complex protein [Candidatus Fermentibacteria bacterium]|nr:MAG: nascent polypeptide-associated complex protein [Candidatus Fermentibacteria bacterium]